MKLIEYQISCSCQIFWLFIFSKPFLKRITENDNNLGFQVIFGNFWLYLILYKAELN